MEIKTQYVFLGVNFENLQVLYIQLQIIITILICHCRNYEQPCFHRGYYEFQYRGRNAGSSSMELVWYLVQPIVFCKEKDM
jgi:hypothetical protein